MTQGTFVLLPAIKPDKNAVTHLVWDTFDRMEETPSGAGTTHTAHGLIIQEVIQNGNSIPSE
jgi:hypothetical protein